MTKNKDELEKLLRRECPYDRLFLVAVDIELSSKERKRIYRLANTKDLPLVFVNDKFIGNYNEVMFLYQRGGLAEYFKRKAQQFTDFSKDSFRAIKLTFGGSE